MWRIQDSDMDFLLHVQIGGMLANQMSYHNKYFEVGFNYFYVRFPFTVFPATTTSILGQKTGSREIIVITPLPSGLCLIWKNLFP